MKIEEAKAEIDAGKTAVWSTERVVTTVARHGDGYRWTLYHLMLPRPPRTVPGEGEPLWDWDTLLSATDGVQTSSDAWRTEAHFSPAELGVYIPS